MALSWFCVWQAPGGGVLPLDPYELNGLQTLVRGCPGLRAGHILLPAQAHDPFYPDAAGSPSLILQLEFGDIAALEDLLRPGGYLACLADPAFLPSLAGAPAAQQAMLTRRYPVAEPGPRAKLPEGGPLSYWVEYEGPAEDDQAWRDAYLRHHPRLLARLPGIRAIEVYTPALALCGLALPLRPCLQRNKTVFDSAQAMAEAMRTPAREALRADFLRFPAFRGAALHFPFATWSHRPHETP